MRWVVAAVCGYETAAICSGGRIPMLTELDRRTHHAVSAVVLGGLAVHFYLEPWKRDTASPDHS